MRISTIVLMILFSSISFAQNAPINFETGGQGATWTWTMFENSTNPALEIINNPFSTGINTSAKVAKFTALKAGQPYAGVESNKNADLGQFAFNETNRVVKIMVYKTVISDVGIKFANAGGWSQGEIKVANTRINEWEELKFDLTGFIINPPAPEAPLSQIIIFPDFSARAQDNIIYFDNITFSAADVTPSGPATPAPTPTRAATDVISLFSNAYTNVAVDTWRTSWSAATLQDITIEGNATKKYSQLDFVGIETVTSQLNITSMTHIHIDVWSSDFTFLGIKLVDFGADGAFGGGNDVEHQVNITTPAKNQWVSLNIPLTDFTGLTTKQHLAQYILVGQPTGTTTIYVDNMYFFSDIPLSVNDYTENQNRVQFYPNPVKSGDKVQLSSDVKQIEVFDLRGTRLKSLNTTSSITTEGLSKGTYFLRIHTNNGLIQTQKLVVK